MFQLLTKHVFKNITLTNLMKIQTPTNVGGINKLLCVRSSNSILPQVDIFTKIEKKIEKCQEERSFAVIHLCGKQFKITNGDIILVEGYWPPTSGDRIRLDKVLLAGSNDFTFVGRPILEPGVCNVQAIIIEKTLSHTKTHFRKKRRKQYERINFHRSPHTMIRINSIEFNSKIIDESQVRNTNSLNIF